MFGGWVVVCVDWMLYEGVCCDDEECGYVDCDCDDLDVG